MSDEKRAVLFWVSIFSCLFILMLGVLLWEASHLRKSVQTAKITQQDEPTTPEEFNEPAPLEVPPQTAREMELSPESTELATDPNPSHRDSFSSDLVFKTDDPYGKRFLSMMPIMKELNRAATRCIEEKGRWCAWDEINFNIQISPGGNFISLPGTYSFGPFFNFRLEYYNHKCATQGCYWEAFMEMHDRGGGYHLDIVSTANGRLQIRSNKEYGQGQQLAESIFGPVQEQHQNWMYWNLEDKKVD